MVALKKFVNLLQRIAVVLICELYIIPHGKVVQ